MRKSSSKLPPRMLCRKKTLKSGKVWVGYYYNGRDENGKRVEIPLGTDLNEAKRKWADMECAAPPVETGLMRVVFDRYEKEILPTKSHRTQKDNLAELKQLRAVFDTAPIDAITPQHIAQYRDKRTAKVRANREIALLSHAFNMAREWGYTNKENPCRGVRKNKEVPRKFYADKSIWDAVYVHAAQELKDAMDITYLSAQRPADVLKMTWADVRDNALFVKQNKTAKFLRIMLSHDGGEKNELGKKLDDIRLRAVTSMRILSTPRGKPLSTSMLRTRFEHARSQAAQANEGTVLGAQIAQFQFRDIRPKAASEIENIGDASKLLGHTDRQITERVYRRVGESVKPTR